MFNFKRPAVIISVIALLLCIVAALCLLTAPKGNPAPSAETAVPPSAAADIAAAEPPAAAAPEGAPGVYLRLNFDGAYQLSIRPCMSHEFPSGGCVNADGSPFKKGELVYIDQLAGLSDLVDFIVTALDENGETLMIDGCAVEQQWREEINSEERLELDFDVPDNSGYAVKNVDEALGRATAELKTLHDMGILSAELTLEADDLRVWSYTGDEPVNSQFPARTPRAYYYISNFNNEYSVHLDLDKQSGKIINLGVQAVPDEGAEPVKELELDNGKTWYYYGNFGDIFPEDITLDEFCSLLNDYWGFDGYTLSGTKDLDYRYDTDVPDGGTLLRDFNAQPYLTVYFEGDEKGLPMYIEIMDFPIGADLMLGIHGHSVG